MAAFLFFCLPITCVTFTFFFFSTMKRIINGVTSGNWIYYLLTSISLYVIVLTIILTCMT